jgi:hypothetical protein
MVSAQIGHYLGLLNITKQTAKVQLMVNYCNLKRYKPWVDEDRIITPESGEFGRRDP